MNINGKIVIHIIDEGRGGYIITNYITGQKCVKENAESVISVLKEHLGVSDKIQKKSKETQKQKEEVDDWKYKPILKTETRVGKEDYNKIEGEI